MKKSILIIGFGDLAERLERHLIRKDYYVCGLTRSPNKYKGSNLIQWDWTLNKEFILEEDTFDSIIFFPTPSEFNEEGYRSGFIESLDLIIRSIQHIKFKSFIGISSTSVYGDNQTGILTEEIEPKPSNFRGSVILEYEKLLHSNFQERSLILRLSGLYEGAPRWMEESIKNTNPKKIKLRSSYVNRLHRDECIQIIDFALEKGLSLENDLINCSAEFIKYEDLFKDKFPDYNFNDYFICPDTQAKEISSQKIRKLGFKFKS